MLARKMMQVETRWEKAETRFKTLFYNLLHEMLQAQIKSPIIYKLLLFIETVQFFWFGIHPNFSFLWTANVANWIRTGVRYFQLDYVLNTGNKSVFLVSLYAVFVVHILTVLLSIITVFQLARSKKKSSTIVTYSLKILSSICVLFNTVFTIPVFNVYMASIICFKEDSIHTNIPCYSGVSFVYLATGIIGLILAIIMLFLQTNLYIDLNPWSTIPFAAPRSKIPLLRLLLKLAVILYIILDYKKNLTKEFIVIYGVIWLGMIVLRYRQTPHYNRSIFRFVLAMDSIMLWTCIVSITHAFLDKGAGNTIGIFFLFFGYPFLAYAVITIIERRQSAFRRLIVKNLKKDDNVEMYINVVFNLIENRDKPLPRIALEGLLKYHIKHCQKKENECACWSLSRDFGKEEEPPEKLWYTWIKHIIVDVLENFPKSTRLHMLYAYIQREKLQNKFKALFEMMITEENKPNMEEEFSIFSYKNVIEEEMIENDARNSESKGVDVNVIVDFQNKFVDFQGAVENAVDLHLEFWRELLENNPDIQKLQTLGSKITHSLEETSAEFRKLNDINPNHIKMLQIYGNYLKDIVNDEVEGQRTLEKAEYVDKSAAVNKQFIDNDHLKYGENSNTCIFTVSGNLSSIGMIKNVNNEITRILGFSKPDLIGQNISRIIPKVIGDLHDGFMKNYFETSEAKVMGMERIVFPLNKEGYVVPCSLMIKVLPNLDEGIRLVGFLKDLDKEGAFAKGSDLEMEEKVHYIMYSGDSLAIHGITYSCKKSFGIPASLVSGHGASNDFTMDIIFPELHSHSAEDLKNAAGVVMTLDTSSLQQNYLLGDSHSNGSEYEEEEEEEEEEKEKKFRKANVRVVLAEDVDYQDTNIKVLKFVEVYEEDFKRELSATRNEMETKEHAKDVLGKTEDESKVEPGDRSAEYNGGSDKESSVSAEGVNDDIKQLKDFKALISEKTVPKSIKLLSRTVIFLLLLLIILAILILKFRIDQASEFKTGISDITQAFDRTDLMANINFQTRELQCHARGLIDNSTTPSVVIEYGFKNALIVLIDSLSTVQFNIMRSAEVLQNDGVNTMDSQNILLEHQVEGGITEDYRIYTDSTFQYITAASSVRNSTLASIITTVSTDSTPKNFYFVRRNGLGTLREGSETESTTFYNYYVDRADYYNKIFLALMIVAIALLAISDFILIPIVFSVHRTNNRVLAFFGYIPLNEIEQLADKCEQYMEKYLEDHKEAHNYSYDEGEEGERSRVDRSRMAQSQQSNHMENSSYVEGSQNAEDSVVDGDSVNPETSMQMDVSERIEVSPVNDFNKGPRQMTLNVPASSTRKNVTGGRGTTPGNVLPVENSMMKSRANDVMMSSQENSKAAFNKSRDYTREEAKKMTTKEEEKKKKEDAELLDIEVNDRIQKLLNSRTNRRSNVVIQFLILAIIFGIYFLLDYVLVELPFRTNVKNILEHLKFTSQRMPFIRYLNAFTLEEIAEGNNVNVYKYTGQPYVNYRQMYSKLIQANEQAITNPANLGFPSQFNDYLNLFNSYNDDDLCEAYYGPMGRLAECQAVSNQILTRGLTLAVTTISLNSDTIINSFNSSVSLLSDSTNQTQLKPAQFAAINSDAFTQSVKIQNYIMPAFGHLQDEFEVAYQSFLNNSKKIEAIKFVIFLLFCFLVFFVLWQPYLKNLKDNIFRTKGMLSMIPMDIISKNDGLMSVFLTGNILQAVK